MTRNSSSEESDQKARKLHLHLVMTCVALLLAAGLLVWSLQGIEWAKVGTILKSVNRGFLAFCCLQTSLALYLRAIRWRLLLTAEAPIGVRAAFWATSAGYFGNNFLPARGGELVRTFMISSRSPLRKSYVLTTAFAERAADAVALVVITGAVLLLLPNKTTWLARASLFFALIGVVGIAAITVLPRMEQFAARVINLLPIGVAIRSKLRQILEQCLRALRSFHDGKRLANFTALTLFIWGTDAIGSWVASYALGMSMTIPVAFLLVAALGLGSALPSAPGYVGIYQFVAVTVLTPFGFSRTDAIAYIIFAQALLYVVIGFWGAIGFWQYKRMSSSQFKLEVQDSTYMSA